MTGTLRLRLTRRDAYCLRCDGVALRTSDYCRSCRDAIERGDIPVPRRMTEGVAS